MGWRRFIAYLAVSVAAGPSVVVTNLTPVSVDVYGHQFEHDSGRNPAGHRDRKLRGRIRHQCHRRRHQLDQQQSGVLTVDTNGNVTAVGTGNATISATVNGVDRNQRFHHRANQRAGYHRRAGNQ